MALNTLKCNYLTPLYFKGLNSIFKRNFWRTMRSCEFHKNYAYTPNKNFDRKKCIFLEVGERVNPEVTIHAGYATA